MSFLARIFAQELSFVFSCPAILWQVIFLYVPFAILALHSVFDFDIAQQAYTFTLVHYQEIFNSLYIKIIFRSFFLAFLTALICFLIAYPVAYFLALKGPRRFKTFLLFSLIFPSWTSLIVQVYAWFFLLEKNGFISRTLQSLGIISSNQHMLNNYFTIIMGMVSCYLPFMILPIYAVLEKMDKNLLEASADLGADRYETFRRVVFPLSLPGVYAGLLLVFTPSFGEFAIPTLLGGSKYVFWGNVIVDKFLRSRDWRVGAALAIIGIMLPVILIALVVVARRVREFYNNRQQPDYPEYLISSSNKDFWS